jgi:putative ABC transport system ATP-binding protein
MKALDALGLGDRYDHMPNQLSGGQQQRVAIARALVNQPTLILADEPTGNLDTKTSIEVMRILQELRERRKITIVLITHEPDIAAYGTRIIMVRDGAIISDKPNTPRNTLEEEQRPAMAVAG